MKWLKLLFQSAFYVLDVILSIASFAFAILVRFPYNKYWAAYCRPTESKPVKHAVIIGYQFAGFEVHKLLQQNEALTHFTFTVIEPKTYFEFTPSVLSVLVDPAKYDSVSFPLASCFDSDRSTLLHGKATSIRSSAVTVELIHNGTTTVPFDYCFICTGSKYAAPIKVNAFPGSSNEVYLEHRRKAFDGIHSKMNNEWAFDGDAQTSFVPFDSRDVAIIGGGPVGVELMAEIVGRFPEKKVTIIDANDRLCRSFPGSTRKYLEDWAMARDRITLRLNSRIREIVTPRHSEHSPPGKTVLIVSQCPDIEQHESSRKSRCCEWREDDEEKLLEFERLEFDVVFKCGGFQPNSEWLLSEESDPDFSECVTGKYRFIAVDGRMRVKGKDRIFALGDVVEQLRVNEIKLAHTAEIHAQYISETVEAMERGGGTAMAEYHEWLLGETATRNGGHHRKWDMPLVYTISLGEDDGSMGFGHIQLNGAISVLLKWFIELSLCTLYQRAGVADISLFGGSKGGFVFRIYPMGYRIFAVIWWFSHRFTMYYIRHFNH